MASRMTAAEWPGDSHSVLLQKLTRKDIGDVVIRPSSRGPTHLSVTMKFHDGIFTTIDIEEGGKDRSSATSLLGLGKTLKIGDEVFEDLDEVGACRQPHYL